MRLGRCGKTIITNYLATETGELRLSTYQLFLQDHYNKLSSD